jgi:Uma2 family endonuclease
MSAEAVPEWLVTPPGGWTADDLDRLPPEAPRCEVLDGALIVMSPQRDFHSVAMFKLNAALYAEAPTGWQVRQEMTIRINRRNRPEPDLVVAYPNVPLDRDRTSYLPEQVALAIEIMSPESVRRDRVVKPHKYARAGIPHYWLIEDEPSGPALRRFELNDASRHYRQVAIEREKFDVAQPFPLTIDVQRLYP